MGKAFAIPIPRGESTLDLFALSKEVLKTKPSPTSEVISTNAWHISRAWLRLSKAHGPAIKAKGRSLPTEIDPI